jgi:hypothetical protein
MFSSMTQYSQNFIFFETYERAKQAKVFVPGGPF